MQHSCLLGDAAPDATCGLQCSTPQLCASLNHHCLLAQVGVQLLLFGLGMEFSIDKLRTVGSVAILGGLIEIGLFIAVSAIGAMLIGGSVADGIFVGALVSMSSTSVVVKMLGDRGTSAVSQIVIGTLILQDCSVGLMFALMPVLASLRDPSSGLDPEAFGEIVLLILKVCACTTPHYLDASVSEKR